MTINYGDDGKIVEGSLPFIAGNKQLDKFGDSDGARIIFENPDSKKTYLVSGSINSVKASFKTIKGKSDYLNAYMLDTGTYVKGLASRTGNITSDNLVNYDGLNIGGGGNALYIKD